MGFLNFEKKVIFLSNHKCGSTTVMDLAQRHNLIDLNTKAKNRGFSNQNKISTPWKHADARTWERYLKLINQDIKDYTTVTTTRNPYDRMVSVFSFKKHHFQAYAGEDKSDFNQFVINIAEQNGYSFAKFISDHKIDHVFKLEELGNVFIDFLNETFDKQISKSEVKRLNRSRRKKYQAYYNERSKEIVRDLFAYEFEKFGYEF